MDETKDIEKKSLRIVTGSKSDFDELAKDCVCFANAYGGKILIGIEKNDSLPPKGQRIENKEFPSEISRRISERSLNVGVTASIVSASNGGEYIELTISRNGSSLASTSDGKYYMRVSDTCKPILPDELPRLMTDKSSLIWEMLVFRKVLRNGYDGSKLNDFIQSIKASDRVSDFTKEKSIDELLDYYFFANGEYLTNLGVLWIGKREHRASLLYAPVVQFIKYDETESKVNKIVWDDFSLNPKELIEAVWNQIPDWKESIEISDGLFRKNIPNYDEVVIRELLANAFAHRPYTTRGDIFINLYSDRLEIHNPGLLPFGVTPENILHKSVKRNEQLTKVFYDLKLMEREGSGYDRMYEILLANGKPIPVPREGDDRTVVTVKKQIINNEVVKLMDRASKEFQLRSKEVISLGIIAQHNSLSAIEFSKILGLKEPNATRHWLGRLPELQLVLDKGKTKGKEYFINPEFLRKLDFKGKTDLKKIVPHRLKELIRQDLSDYKKCSISEIQSRIGKEISISKIRIQLKVLNKENFLRVEGINKWRRYILIENPV